ncbi:hypothetical protein Ngar_c25580 [Candidatus Nitrososphaera gargensis Ga9.2]|uniref:Uncharacterized protein n=1 Tax=Nitrososphaera gargensis (strain Ga9.2) TaxID=1237085 RepID=K0IHR5_NITGG|nr:hypothetical protein [Candidatus Nitrososphaera gargensis]AFU59480.1 hypothetical protein Ngar_c25580 [Candidatus Nitrososphaera gargensis Ga9.2]
MRWKEEIGGRKRGRNWMSAMGILFMVSAAIILIRNIVLFYIDHSIGLVEDPAQLFLNNFVNNQVTNEKFAIAMIAAGCFLLYWGFFRKNEDYGPPDEHEWRRLNR